MQRVGAQQLELQELTSTPECSGHLYPCGHFQHELQQNKNSEPLGQQYWQAIAWLRVLARGNDRDAVDCFRIRLLFVNGDLHTSCCENEDESVVSKFVQTTPWW